ncbi:MAG: HAMP domain-containing histidine kinase [Clostridia bacterium]|nr:HAMP domain-containing histidine kinase [Clostridia bacterium]
MKKQITLQKWIAWVLFIVSTAALVMAGALTVIGAAVGIYDAPIEGVEDHVFRQMIHDDMWSVAAEYHDRGAVENDRGNIRFEVSKADAPDVILASNMQEGEVLLAETEQLCGFDGGYVYYEESEWEETVYCVHIGVSAELKAEDRYQKIAPLFTTFMKYGPILAAVTAVSFVLAVASGVWLCFLAGKREGKEGIFERRFDKWPLIAVLLFYILAIIGNCGLAALLFDDIFYDWSWLSWYGTSLWKLMVCLFVLVLLLDAALLALLLATVSVRIKCHTFWKRTLIGHVLSLIGKGFKVLPFVWKSAVIYLGVTFAEIIMAMALFSPYCDDEIPFFVVIVKNTILAIPYFWVAANLKRMKYSVLRLADGDIGYKTDASGLFGEFKEAALDLNRLSDGLGLAVEARTKSERMKTELITNVSHDIKTPLTSIVSYADLIGREETENEKIHEYADILKKQSTRLKKLLEDLVEASKAATGNIKATLMPCDAGVLITQAVGEYEEKLAEHDLTLITDLPETPVTVAADGRLTQRVLDNLMQNITKYAKEGTRVFLTLNEAGQVTVKNTSRDLILHPEELSERFVRGESSRTSEGNGLGLAIASSLMQTMGGSLKIDVDGDLFKVTLQFGGVSVS